jgi:lipopolysaccharide transport system ATP-binding protein
MDEWLSVGDNDFIVKAKNRLNNIVNSAQIVFIASHDHNLIKEQCTRILTLSHGNLILDERNCDYE